MVSSIIGRALPSSDEADLLEEVAVLRRLVGCWARLFVIFIQVPMIEFSCRHHDVGCPAAGSP